MNPNCSRCAGSRVIKDGRYFRVEGPEHPAISLQGLWKVLFLVHIYPHLPAKTAASESLD